MAREYGVRGTVQSPKRAMNLSWNSPATAKPLGRPLPFDHGRIQQFFRCKVEDDTPYTPISVSPTDAGSHVSAVAA
jgi:hypothetical protein